MKVLCQRCGTIYEIPVGHDPRGYSCSKCGNPVLVEVRPIEVRRQPNPNLQVGGVLGGAAIGGSIGGPAGAIIGGLIGLLVGTAANDKP